MAAKGEQIPALSPIAAPSNAPDPTPGLPPHGAAFADGEVPIESVVTAGRAAADEVLQGRNPQGDSLSPVVPPQEDGVAKDEQKATPDRDQEDEEEEEAEDGEQGGGGGSGGGGGGGGKRGERKGALFLPDAKRRKACPAALEKLPTPPAAEELGPGDRGGRDGAPGGGESSPSFSFSFSFDTRGFWAPPIETTPKFGSFNFAASSSDGSGAEALGTATAGGGDEVRRQDAEGGAL